MNRLHGLLRKGGTAIKLCGQHPCEGEQWVVRSLNLLDNAQHTDQTINAKKPDVNGDNDFRSSNKLYRSTVFWTPSGLKLGCSSQGTQLLMSHLGRGFISMPPNEPGLIVLTLKLVQCQAECFHGIKSLEP